MDKLINKYKADKLILDYDEIIHKVRNFEVLYIFGAGSLGAYVKDLLKEAGISITGFCDNDVHKWDLEFYGARVFSPDVLKEHGEKQMILVVSDFADEIMSQLQRMGITNFVNLTYWPLTKNINLVRQVYDLLADENSRKTLLSILDSRVHADQYRFTVAREMQYFHPVGGPQPGDVIIDGGAFQGDTAYDFVRFLNRQCTIFSFEPSEQNYQIMYGLIKDKGIEDKIFPIKAGLFNCTGLQYFDADSTSMASHHIVESGAEKIEVVSIDEFVSIKKIKPTLIKMDIEGCEAKAIQGAVNTIRTFQPRLQICLYHKADDIWNIPLQINSLCPRHKLYMARHGFGGSAEIVLYAVPEKRCI